MHFPPYGHGSKLSRQIKTPTGTRTFRVQDNKRRSEEEVVYSKTIESTNEQVLTCGSRCTVRTLPATCRSFYPSDFRLLRFLVRALPPSTCAARERTHRDKDAHVRPLKRDVHRVQSTVSNSKRRVEVNYPKRLFYTALPSFHTHTCPRLSQCDKINPAR
jgi:hypothetical protein